MLCAIVWYRPSFGYVEVLPYIGWWCCRFACRPAQQRRARTHFHKLPHNRNDKVHITHTHEQTHARTNTANNTRRLNVIYMHIHSFTNSSHILCWCAGLCASRFSFFLYLIVAASENTELHCIITRSYYLSPFALDKHVLLLTSTMSSRKHLFYFLAVFAELHTMLATVVIAALLRWPLVVYLVQRHRHTEHFWSKP